MKILLVQPEAREDFMSAAIRDITYLSWRGSGAQVAPLAIATVAGLTPPGHDVRIHDENTRGPVEQVLEKEHFDIVGISCLMAQFQRSYNIARFVKDHGAADIVALGGPGTGIVPTHQKSAIDVVFFGEAEETWPQFLDEYQRGEHKPYYQQVSKPDMSLSPIPRWDLIAEDMKHYATGSVQTTRGCPFDCAFCDVIYLYGRKPRTKDFEQVLEEIRIQQRLGVRFIFIADDDFAGNKKRSKELLRELVKLNNSFPIPIRFMTQADLTIAGDEELLALMADAGFVNVLVGIESANDDSLRDLNKLQNLRQGVREGIRKVQSYGIAVFATMIVGADSDDTETFDKTAQFLIDENIADTFCSPLMAPPGTKLWYQFRREHRLLEVPPTDINTFVTNIIPKKMSRIQLLEGCAAYWDKTYDPLHYLPRIVGFINGVKRQPQVKFNPFRSFLEFWPLLLKVFWFFTFQVSKEHRKAFYAAFRATRHKRYMMPAMFFLHTRYLINEKRAKMASERALRQASWERTHPDALPVAEAAVPVPQQIRDASKEIFGAAYAHVRQRINKRATLLNIVVEAMVDYVDRWGESFRSLDPIHETYIRESCDRIMADVPDHELTAHDDEGLPLRPPPGFTREILDGLDSAIRHKAGLDMIAV